MMCLEVGPGANRSYGFAPRTPICCTAVFLDIEPPSGGVSDCGMWVVADAQMLPLRSSSFSHVYASHVIEHLRSPATFLREARRVLVRGGFLEVWTPNFLSVNAKRDPTHLHVFNLFTLWRMAKSVGFKFHLPIRVASRLPRPLQRLLSIIVNFFLDELHVVLEKV